ncbi:MAG: hypothetical protein H6662_03220 [Ardenticatenaceae bacterium]|nr:hypothetical protein [Ardenticatenaceae bacterium]MCB8990195.1 hypothetical protein [Ardenticatenaceae bacterium]MCB9003014.1 hypothetical protein [Ardenticatenaceae bacterium]
MATKEAAQWRSPVNTNVLAGGALVTIGILAVLLVWLGPDEKTLGSGIKAVYVHVSLTWAGLLGFVTAALIGLAQLITRGQSLNGWRRTVGWVAFGFYVAGVAASALASQLNWGAVFWQEPRMVTSLNMLAVALIVQVAQSYFPRWWLQAALSVLLPVLIFWANLSAPLVLHPDNAVRNSTATGIQLTFLGMMALMAAAEGIVVVAVKRDA